MVTTKSLAPFSIKATDDDARTFTGLASTWDLDLGGDLIKRGAFKGTLAAWQKSGRILPLLDSHNAYGSVENVVGKMLEAKETQDGLLATFQLLEDDRKADAVYRRIKDGYVDGLSIGYRAKTVSEPDEADRKQGVWRIIKELELMEVSVVLWPMNPDARIDQVKSLLDGAAPPMTEAERREWRALASRIGTLISTAPSAKADDAPPEGDPKPKQDPPQPNPTGAGDPPPAADAQGEEKTYEFAEALNQRMSHILGGAGASST